MQKRNNVFMLAYITFIIFSITLRFFADYELWGPIVLAITISSIFFAIEDFFRSIHRSLGDLCEIANSFVDKARDKTNQDLKTISSLVEKASEYSNSKFDIAEVIETTQKRKQLIESAIVEVDKMERAASKKRMTQKKCGKAADWFAFFGFFSLFCVLIIASLFAVGTLAQEVMTVITFVVILLTQYINGLISQSIKRSATDSENALCKYEETQKSLQRMEKDFYRLIDAVDKLEMLCKEQEEIDKRLSEI